MTNSRKCEKQSGTCGFPRMLTLGATWASWRRWGSSVQGALRFTHTYHSNQANNAFDGKHRRSSIIRKIGATLQCPIVTLIEHEQANSQLWALIPARNPPRAHIEWQRYTISFKLPQMKLCVLANLCMAMLVVRAAGVMQTGASVATGRSAGLISF